MLLRLVAIERVADSVYYVALEGRAGDVSRYTFEVQPGAIPVVTWSDSFEAEVGTLSGDVEELLAAVLAFHKAAVGPDEPQNKE